MNFKPLLQPLGLAVLLLASQAAPRGADVHGEHENPNQAFGQEASYSKPSGVVTYDGVHPTAKGNELLAHLISDGIVRALALEKPTAVLVP